MSRKIETITEDDRTDMSILDREDYSASAVKENNSGDNASAAGPNTAMEESDAGQSAPDLRRTVEEEDALDAAIAILLRDGLDQPIKNLPVKIDLPNGTVIEAVTDENGLVALPSAEEKKGQAKLSVQDASGQNQEVCKIDLTKCTGGVAIARSPKVAAKVRLKPHHQRKPSSQSAKSEAPPALPAPASASEKAPQEPEPHQGYWFATTEFFNKVWHWLSDESHPKDSEPPAAGGSAPHVAKEAANKSGNPIAAIVGPECPNKDNLQLLKNNIYKKEILKAAERVGLIPQAIAALIDAEAATVDETVPLTNPDGTPKILKSGKRKGKQAVVVTGKHWDSNSHNGTGAAGLTQFLVGTWLNHVMLPGYFIHEQSITKGWVKQTKDKKGKSKIVFVLSNGDTTDKPWQHKGDDNVKACLDQRFIPEWSILAAADYGNANLKLLKNMGFKLQNLNDAEKAKLMYLMHHEGEGAGPLVIRNRLSELPKGKFATVEARIRNTFIQQVGEKRAKGFIEDENDNVAKAYRKWLASYIDQKIDFQTFCCDASKIPRAADALTLFKKIGGEE